MVSVQLCCRWRRFLAHALGTLVGALVAYFVAGQFKRVVAYGVGLLSLCGGIAASFVIPAPAAFIVIDLVLDHIPMAWIAVKLSGAIQGNRASRATTSTA